MVRCSANYYFPLATILSLSVSYFNLTLIAVFGILLVIMGNMLKKQIFPDVLDKLEKFGGTIKRLALPIA